jgi:hypothetical protein
MKILTSIYLLTLTFFVAANGKYDIHKKYSFDVDLDKGELSFYKFKSSLSGKLSGYVKNNSPNYIKWVWFDFERFDKNNNKTTVAKTYPQLLFLDIPSLTQKKIKGVSMVGIKWLNSFNFEKIIGIEYAKEFYIDYAKLLKAPILIKTMGIKYNRGLLKNEIHLNWINTGNDISKISFSFEGINKLGDKIKIEPIISFVNIDRVIKDEEKTDIWRSWDNDAILCPLLNSVEIHYLNGSVSLIQGGDLKMLIYSPVNGLYPSQSIEILNCMGLKLLSAVSE